MILNGFRLKGKEINKNFQNNLFSSMQNLNDWTVLKSGASTISYEDEVNTITFNNSSPLVVPANTPQRLVDRLAADGITITLASAQDLFNRTNEGAYPNVAYCICTDNTITFSFYSRISTTTFYNFDKQGQLPVEPEKDPSSARYAWYDNVQKRWLSATNHICNISNNIVGARIGGSAGTEVFYKSDGKTPVKWNALEKDNRGYVAPNGNVYKYKLNGISTDSYWYASYSDLPYCFCSDDLYSTLVNNERRYQPICIIDKKVGYISAINGSNNSSFYGVYPTTSGAATTSNYLIYFRGDATPISNTNIYFTAAKDPLIPIFETIQECYNYLISVSEPFSLTFSYNVVAGGQYLHKFSIEAYSPTGFDTNSDSHITITSSGTGQTYKIALDGTASETFTKYSLYYWELGTETYTITFNNIYSNDEIIIKIKNIEDYRIAGSGEINYLQDENGIYIVDENNEKILML